MNDSTTKCCRTCGFEYPLTPEYFYRNSETHDGFQNSCKVCRSLSCGHVPKEKYPEGYKRCNACQELKPLNEFHKYNRARDGHRYTCKACRAKVEGFNYKQPARDGYKRCCTCKLEFPIEDFYQKDVDRLHGDCVRCYSDRQKRYRHKYPEKARARVQKRIAQRKANGGVYTAADVALQLKSQKGLCWWCGKPLDLNRYHVDHRIPIHRGGNNNPGNIVIAHPKCNQKKNAKMPWEWCGRLL